VLLRKENKQLKAKLVQFEQDKAKWETANRELAALRREVEDLRAMGVVLKGKLFGRKSEMRAEQDTQTAEEWCGEVGPSGGGEARARGQQPGSIGHGRRIHRQLPPEVIVHEVSADKRACPKCGKAYEDMEGAKTSEEIDWDVVIR